MPLYEVTIRPSKPVLVRADDETEAERVAEEEGLGDFNRIEAEVEGTLDEVEDAEIIEEYKRKGSYYEA